MNGIIRGGIIFCVGFVTLIVLCAQLGFAQDNLFLSGIVRSFDSNSGIIRINVTSEGCKGLREFRIPGDAAKDFDATLVGQRVQFYIDSATCASGRTYNMLIGGQP